MVKNNIPHIAIRVGILTEVAWVQPSVIEYLLTQRSSFGISHCLMTSINLYTGNIDHNAEAIKCLNSLNDDCSFNPKNAMRLFYTIGKIQK